MAEIIEMPKLSDTMTVGTLVRWLKQPGEPVASGDMLAEIETDKATMELENFTKGVMLKHYIAVGDQVPVGAPLCAVGQAGEAAPEVAAAAPKAPAAEKPTPVVPAAPVAPISPTAPTVAPVATPNAAPVVAASCNEGRIKASPLAKKIALSEGVSLSCVPGTGPGGRIVRADVLKSLKAGTTNPAALFSASGAYSPALEGKTIPVTGLRAAIARRLIESKQQTPHFYLEIEIDAAPLEDFRGSMNTFFAEATGGAVKLTVNDIILRATALALAQLPSVNASWQETTIVQHGTVDLAFGVAIEDGLVTPVIRSAHAKSLRDISIETKSLIGKARSRKLKPDEMSGSTFTVTNLGMFGITSFHGIINPPNAGILSVGGTFKKPVVNENDEIVIGRRMIIGFSGDHRVVDGALGAHFLGKLKILLESPCVLMV